MMWALIAILIVCSVLICIFNREVGEKTVRDSVTTFIDQYFDTYPERYTEESADLAVYLLKNLNKKS